MKPPESRHKNKIMARQKNIEEMTTSEAQKEFGNLLERLAYTKSYPDAFSLFLDFALLPFNLEPTPEEKERFQKLTDEDKRTLLAMLSCFGIITDNNGEGFKDALGDLFMEHVSHGNNGQFFTPEPLCQFMSLATGVDELKPGQSMCDPTCGSGRMLLAAAKIAAEKGNRNIWLYGSDLDLTCCKMAALNMLVNSMQGEIAHMNTYYYGSLPKLAYSQDALQRRSLASIFLPHGGRTNRLYHTVGYFNEAENISLQTTGNSPPNVGATTV